MPVFPPIEESTWASKVVGIFTYKRPLLNILETYADKSPIIPPPIDMRQSVLLKLFFNRISIILSTLFCDLFFSLESI